MSRYFPLFVNLQERKIVLFGAGKIAARRLRGLLEFGARVTVISPEIGEEVRNLAEQYPERVQVIHRMYQPGDGSGAALVLSATNDPQADRQIHQECKQTGIPVNVASDQELCDFYFPALIEHDGLVIGVSSGGSDHKKVRTVSARLRDALSDREESSCKP